MAKLSGAAGSSSSMSGSCNLSVTVNGGLPAPSGRLTEGEKKVVTITPLPPGFHLPVTNRPLAPSAVARRVQPPKGNCMVLNKIFLKAVGNSNAKDVKTFTVRNVDTSTVQSVSDLKKVIRNTLHDDITTKDFDVGYIQGSAVVRIRSKDDLSEMWSELKSKSNVSMWCDGLVSSKNLAERRSICQMMTQIVMYLLLLSHARNVLVQKVTLKRKSKRSLMILKKYMGQSLLLCKSGSGLS